ncbi:hypothetical protein V8G54_028236 [Vigna mungo]|uniref:Uncharacterized protein n=1 Tax=Vigna mungo TaxID=3915 RepID=A0AAQ3RLI1_VIGMU
MEVRQSSSGTSRGTWTGQRVMWRLPNDNALVVAAGAEGLVLGRRTICRPYLRIRCSFDDAGTKGSSHEWLRCGERHSQSDWRLYLMMRLREGKREQCLRRDGLTPQEREKRAEEVAEHLVESDTTNKLFCYYDQRQVDLSEIPERVEAANSGFYLFEPCGVSAGMNGGCRRLDCDRHLER